MTVDEKDDGGEEVKRTQPGFSLIPFFPLCFPTHPCMTMYHEPPLREPQKRRPVQPRMPCPCNLYSPPTGSLSKSPKSAGKNLLQNPIRISFRPPALILAYPANPDDPDRKT